MKKLLLSLLLLLPLLAQAQFNPNSTYATVNNACGWNGYLQGGTYYSNAGVALAGLPSCTQPLVPFPNGIQSGAALPFTDTGVGGTSVGSLNGYWQFILQNMSAGTAASTDYIVNNNLGTASTYYGDFGMNSSAFTGSGSFNLANAVYLYSFTGDLVLGSQTANAIHFVVNNAATDAATIDTTSHTLLGGGVAPTIASGACGATTNGTISGSDQAGKVTIGAASTTTCTVSFGSTWATAPRACTFSPASSGAAALTVLAYVSAVSATSFTITGSVLASTVFYYHCF